MITKDNDGYENIIGAAEELVQQADRDTRLSEANHLAQSISVVLGHKVAFENGVPNWLEATRQLVEQAHLNPVRAWMLAEVVALGAVSAHELVNVEPVDDERLHYLTQALAEGAVILTSDCYKTT